jgi:hypothetical protein
VSRRLAVTALAVYGAILAAVTLGASPAGVFAWGAHTAHRVGGLYWISTGDVERAANVLLFVPAGFLLCYALPGASRWLVWALCLALSLSIETVQLVLPGREASAVDLATNALGAGIGVLIQAAVSRARSRR